MLEQVTARLVNANLPNADQKGRAKDAITNCLNVIRALGANVTTTDGGTSTTLTSAISAAKANVNGQSWPGVDVKQLALGEIDALAGQLASLGLT